MLATRGLGIGQGQIALWGLGREPTTESVVRSSGRFVYLPPLKKKKKKIAKAEQIIREADSALRTDSVAELERLKVAIDAIQASLALSARDAEIRALMDRLEAREQEIEEALFMMLMM